MPLYRFVYRSLRGRVLSGALRPGAQLDSEAKLVEEFGVSLITVRQALKMLADEGLLVKKQGRGTFVTEEATGRLKALLVCGLGHTDSMLRHVGAYYADNIEFCRKGLSGLGLGMDIAWLENNSPERALPYCSDELLAEYVGFIFVGCVEYHALLRKVIEKRLRHVHIGQQSPAPNRVWRNLGEGIRMGMRECTNGRKTLIAVMGLADARLLVENAARSMPGLKWKFHGRKWEGESVETLGYTHMRELLEAGEPVSRILFVDDMIARGATRAMLSMGAKIEKVCVICGRQEIVPLGLPVTHVTHDTEKEAQAAVAMLGRQIAECSSEAEPFECGYTVLAADDEEIVR